MKVYVATYFDREFGCAETKVFENKQDAINYIWNLAKDYASYDCSTDDDVVVMSNCIDFGSAVFDVCEREVEK